MKALLRVALFDMRQQVADRSSIFFMFLMPIGFILLFGTVFRDRPVEPPRVGLPVVDADGDFLAHALIEQLRGEAFDVEVHASSDSVLESLGTRYLQIAPGFSDSVVAARPARLRLVKRPDSSLGFDAAADLKLRQAQARFVGNLLRWQPPVAASAAELSAAEKGRFLTLVDEPANVSLLVGTAGRGRPVPSGMGQSIPGMLAMFVVMTVLISGSDAITREKRDGMLRRLATTVLSRREIIAGKLVGLVFVGLAQAAIIVAATEVGRRIGVLDTSFSWLPLLGPLSLLIVPYTFAVAGVGLFLSAIFRTNQQAESLAWLVGMVFAGLGGCWWPLEIVPGWLGSLGHVFPTAWAMDGLHALITFGLGASALLLPAAVLLFYGAAFAGLGVRLLRIDD